MRTVDARQTRGYPSITDRRHWRSYAAGMATEILFVLALTAVAFVLAVIATVIWR